MLIDQEGKYNFKLFQTMVRYTLLLSFKFYKELS